VLLPVRTIYAITLISLAVLSGGCGFAKFEDATHELAYSELGGATLVTNSELRIHGVTMDRNYAPILDHYTITTRPGIGGPEVLSKRAFPKGISLKVVGVQRCTNCPFENRVQVLVRPIAGKDYLDAPIKFSYGLYEAGAIQLLK
jgi:hypothetical protein